jgi:hypothetical protein
LQAWHDSFDLTLRVVPRHADFPAQAQVQGQVRLDPERVLSKRSAIPAAGIEKLHAALVVILGRADQKIGEVVAGFGSVEGKVAAGRAHIALIDLQVAELAPKLQGVPADDLGEIV